MLYTIYTCIFEQHDLPLLALAALICGLAAYTTFSLAARARHTDGNNRINWLLAAATALGSGVWATHFVSMLSFRPGQGAQYALWPTILSIGVTILLSFTGLLTAAQRRGWGCLVGGAIIGAGIGAMHYVGMSALRIRGDISYDATLVSTSVLSGILLGALSMRVGFHRRGLRARIAAAALLVLGICMLHFIGMAAVSISAAADNNAIGSDAIPSGLLAIAVASVTVLILALGLIGSVVSAHLDRRAAGEAARLRASEERFRELANATFEGIIFHSNGIIRDANEALCRLLGRSIDELIGSDGIRLVSEKTRATAIYFLQEQPTEALEVELIDVHGNSIPVEIQARSMALHEASIQVVAVRDLRERKRAQEHIHHIAHHDNLTGLPNRKLFVERLEQTMRNAQRNNTSIALLCLDLDRFKQVNDLLGHWGGDELLRAVAQRLKDSLRSEDTVARFGGDEFTIIQAGATSEDAPAALAERLVRCMQEPFVLNGQQVIIGTSIGVALYPGDAGNGDELLRAADTALYRAKESGRNHFRFFEASMDQRLQERAELERDLRMALMQSRDLELHYQPLVDCVSGELTGYEALARWHHPQRGAVSPAEFIPLAEDCGLILPLGKWVLHTACRAAASWPQHLRVAVNLSPAQFRHGDLAADVFEALAASGLPPHRLELEITEGVLITDTETTLNVLTRLKQAGIHIALDDFGTGYSSLSYLQRFPFDKLKIDRSFIWQMENNQESMSIVRAVIALGRSLQIVVTAEGVETPQQLELLRHERCDQVQGFLLGRPTRSPSLRDGSAHYDDARVAS